MIWTLQFAGWLSLCCFFFYFTSVWGQQAGASPGSVEFSDAVRFATLLLTAHGVVFTIAGGALPFVVRACGGEQGALCVALVMIMVVLLSFGTAPPFCGALGLLLVLPLAYQIVANVPYTWVERQPGFDEADRGRLTGRLNVSLAAAQAVIALASGPIVAAARGQLTAAYLACASLDAVVLLMGTANIILQGREKNGALALLLDA